MYSARKCLLRMLHLRSLSKNVEEGLESLNSLNSNTMSVARRMKKEIGIGTHRKINYTEGELDNSHLDLPPSSSNPHPFDPDSANLPPIHSHSIVPFVNHSEVLRLLVEIGVDLAEIDRSTNIGKYLVRLTMQEMKSKIELMQNSMGFENEEIGPYLTRNPFFLLQNDDDIQTRLNYLEKKKFTKPEITKLVREYRYWLNCGVTLIDSRLGWLQKQFKLTAKATRSVIVKEPRIIMFGTGPLERIVKMCLKELNFTDNQLKKLVIDDPRIFMMDPKIVTKNYRFVRDVMHINNETIFEHPLILRCSLSATKSRHDFLKKLGRAYFKLANSEELKNDESKISDDGTKLPTDLVNLDDFLHPSDAKFAILAAKTYPVAYERFLRNS